MQYDKEIFSPNAEKMVEEAHQLIFDSLGKLKYVNLKVKEIDVRESTWFYNVDFRIVADQLVVSFANSDTPSKSFSLNSVEYLKLRPYYKALCVGFKNIIFYNSQYQKGEIE